LLAVAGVGFFAPFGDITSTPAFAAEQVTVPWVPSDPPNEPMGKARGVFPGRVTWAHDPTAVSWNFEGNWWEDRYNSQAVIDRMLAGSIRQLGGGKTIAESWKALFRTFNQRRGRGATGYAAGEKIAIKINMNNTSSHAVTGNLNASPHLVLALLRELVHEAGAAPADITVFDASRFITDDIFKKCHVEFSQVHFVDHIGGDGREKVEFKANAIPYTQDNHLAKDLATCATEATYLIDLALLKGHGGGGVTLCAKNWYGATSINSDFRLNRHDSFNARRDGKASYLTFVDFMAHKDLGEKTVLFLIDALYANRGVGGSPKTLWRMAPFEHHWPASVFASQDGVAIDSVGLDFFRAEFPDAPDLLNADFYLHEAALADHAPSGIRYDPERTGTAIGSLGVHEHWNSAEDKKYSRNLSSTGNGIELVVVR